MSAEAIVDCFVCRKYSNSLDDLQHRTPQACASRGSLRHRTPEMELRRNYFFCSSNQKLKSYPFMATWKPVKLLRYE